MSLRASQLKTLEIVFAFEPTGLRATDLAHGLSTTRDLAEARLRRLEDRAYLSGSYGEEPSWNRKYRYRLTDKGRAELEGEGS